MTAIAAAAVAVAVAGGGGGRDLVLPIAGVHGGAVASGRILVRLLAGVLVLQELDVGGG